MADRDDADQDDDSGYDQAIFRYTKQAYTHLLVNALLVFLLLGGFVVGLIVLKNTVADVEMLLAIKPENRAEAMEKKIAKTRQAVEQQYADYKAKMEDDSIYAVNKKFEVIYEVSSSSEQDYSALLSLFQDAAYQVASKTRGSGEWFYYYEKELKQFALRQRQRQAKLDAYLERTTL